MRALSLVLLVISAGNLFAQSTGQLAGSVVDATGASVPGAKVSLLLPHAKAAALATTATSDGLFNFTGVRPDTYTLTVEAKGFTTYKANGVIVDSVRTTSLAP